MLIDLELEDDLCESGLAGDVETVGDSDKLETGSCLQDLVGMEIQWKGVELEMRLNLFPDLIL